MHAVLWTERQFSRQGHCGLDYHLLTKRVIMKKSIISSKVEIQKSTGFEKVFAMISHEPPNELGLISEQCFQVLCFGLLRETTASLFCSGGFGNAGTHATMRTIQILSLCSFLRKICFFRNLQNHSFGVGGLKSIFWFLRKGEPGENERVKWLNAVKEQDCWKNTQHFVGSDFHFLVCIVVRLVFLSCVYHVYHLCVNTVLCSVEWHAWSSVCQSRGSTLPKPKLLTSQVHIIMCVFV